jgi:hypothetical protein
MLWLVCVSGVGEWRSRCICPGAGDCLRQTRFTARLRCTSRGAYVTSLLVEHGYKSRLRQAADTLHYYSIVADRAALVIECGCATLLHTG